MTDPIVRGYVWEHVHSDLIVRATPRKMLELREVGK